MKKVALLLLLFLVILSQACMRPPGRLSPPAATPESTPVGQPPPTDMEVSPTDTSGVATGEPQPSPAPSETATAEAVQPTEVQRDPDGSLAPVSGMLADVARAVRRDIVYCTVGGVDLMLDLYAPKGTTGVVPLVVYIHGGGWSKGDKRAGAGLPAGPDLLEAGFALASLNYRLAPEYGFPAMIEDVKCAIRYLRTSANMFSYDPDRIGVFGSSAGAHLSNLVGLADTSAGWDVGEHLEQSSRVQAVVELFGPVDLTVDFSKTFVDLKPTVFGSYDMAAASPVTYISPDDPPFLLLHGDMDHVVPLAQAELFYNRLVAAGVPAELVVVRNGKHGFPGSDHTPTSEELWQMIVDFFSQYLK